MVLPDNDYAERIPTDLKNREGWASRGKTARAGINLLKREIFLGEVLEPSISEKLASSLLTRV
jgi:hypothetical protein